jgi:hypothetical protein
MTIMSEVVLLLPNTDRLQQVEDYVRGCSTSTKYWPPSTSWWLCQRLCLSIKYHTCKHSRGSVLLIDQCIHVLPLESRSIPSCSSGRKVLEEVKSSKCLVICLHQGSFLLLLNTDRLQQDDDYVRGCSTSTKYWPPSTSWRLCQRLFYFYQILTVFNKVKIMSLKVVSIW